MQPTQREITSMPILPDLNKTQRLLLKIIKKRPINLDKLEQLLSMKKGRLIQIIAGQEPTKSEKAAVDSLEETIKLLEDKEQL